MIADILRLAVVMLGLALVYSGLRNGWLALRELGTNYKHGLSEPEPMEPEAYGDTCGWRGDGNESDRPAPEIGTGLRAGDGPDLPAFLKRTRGDQAVLKRRAG